MIEIICDNCERTFELSDDHAGGKVECPMCGDVNRVPAATRPAAAPAPDRLPVDEGPEQEIRIVRPAMFRAHPFRFLLVLLLVIGGFALCIAASWSEEDKLPDWLAWPGLVMHPVARGRARSPWRAEQSSKGRRRRESGRGGARAAGSITGRGYSMGIGCAVSLPRVGRRRAGLLGVRGCAGACGRRPRVSAP